MICIVQCNYIINIEENQREKKIIQWNGQLWNDRSHITMKFVAVDNQLPNLFLLGISLCRTITFFCIKLQETWDWTFMCDICYIWSLLIVRKRLHWSISIIINATEAVINIMNNMNKKKSRQTIDNFIHLSLSHLSIEKKRMIFVVVIVFINYLYPPPFSSWIDFEIKFDLIAIFISCIRQWIIWSDRKLSSIL